MINKLFAGIKEKAVLTIYQNLKVFIFPGGFVVLLKHHFSGFLLAHKSSLSCFPQVPLGQNTTAVDCG